MSDVYPAGGSYININTSMKQRPLFKSSRFCSSHLDGLPFEIQGADGIHYLIRILDINHFEAFPEEVYMNDPLDQFRDCLNEDGVSYYEGTKVTRFRD